MNPSSRFMSLSGISGVLAGSFALTGSYLVYITVYQGQEYMAYRKAVITLESLTQLLVLLTGVTQKLEI